MDNIQIEKSRFASIRLSGSVKAREKRFSGPISGQMWELVEKLDSAYPDTFDYSIYDRLLEKFPPANPNFGVVFKTTLRLVNSYSSCSQCHYAFELDTYGRGCIHECVFCYAKDILTHRGTWNRPIPFPVDISKIRKTFATVFESDKPSKWRDILEKRIPLRLGAMSDCFLTMDKHYRVTYEVLKILGFYNYPYIIFTRGDLVANDEYMNVMRKDLVSVQMSISGDNEKLNALMEPGAPSLKRRFSALKKLSKEGFWTTVRVNPLFPTYPDGFFSNVNECERWAGPRNKIEKFPLLDITNLSPFIDSVVEAGVPSVLAGFVRLSSYSVKRISEATAFDFSSFFHPGARRGTYCCFSDSEIAYYYKKLQSELSKKKIRFNTCYIGNGEKDYFQYQTLWKNKKDCCDARGNVQGIEASSQEIDWPTRFKFAKSKDVAYESMSSLTKASKKFSKLALHNRFLNEIKLNA